MATPALFRISTVSMRMPVAVALVAFCGFISAARADERFAPIADPIVAKECRSCHMLYPAGLLTASSWQRLVAGLKSHFGENAEVDEATTKHLVAYLSANAAPEGKSKAAVPAGVEPPLRITELPWFIRKHRGNRIAPETLKRKNAKSAADCLACHKDGEKGDFGD